MELARIKRPINRSAIARQNPCGSTPPTVNPVSVVGGGATVGSGGTGAGISSSPGNQSGQFSNTRFFFNNYSPYYWNYYTPWWWNYGYWGGYPGAWGWPMGYGFGSTPYWPEWPTQQYWPGPYAYNYGYRRYPVVAVA